MVLEPAYTMNIAVTRHTTVVVSALTALLLAILTAQLMAQPSTGPDPTPVEQLDAATAEAVALQEEIADLEAESIAIDTRLDVLQQRIAAQQGELRRARRELKQARGLYGDRVISMYKNGSASPFLMLFEAESLQDLLARSSLMTRIATSDRDIWETSARAAADAHYQSSVLEDLLAQEDELHDMNESRRLTLDRSLERQEDIVSRLTQEAEAYVDALRAKQATTRKEWETSSIPLTSTITLVDAVVEPYVDRTYLVPEHQPTRYRSTGRKDVMVCSWYGNEFHGRRTASGQIFNENDFTCASKTLEFGTRLALTRGSHRIVVVVTDRGPFIAGRDLDLSKAAAYALGFSGVEPVHVEFVEAVAAP